MVIPERVRQADRWKMPTDSGFLPEESRIPLRYDDLELSTPVGYPRESNLVNVNPNAPPTVHVPRVDVVRTVKHLGFIKSALIPLKVSPYTGIAIGIPITALATLGAVHTFKALRGKTSGAAQVGLIFSGIIETILVLQGVGLMGYSVVALAQGETSL
jgi:hypothetical protein